MIYVVAGIYFIARLYSAYRYMKSRKRHVMTHMSNFLMSIFMTSMLLASSWGYLLVVAIDSKSQVDQVDTWDPGFELAGVPLSRGMMYVVFTTVQLVLWVGIQWASHMFY